MLRTFGVLGKQYAVSIGCKHGMLKSMTVSGGMFPFAVAKLSGFGAGYVVALASDVRSLMQVSVLPAPESIIQDAGCEVAVDANACRVGGGVSPYTQICKLLALF